jgi:hypothetical protein
MKFHEFQSHDGFTYRIGSVGASDGLHCALVLARAAEPVLTAGGMGADLTVALVQALADPKFEAAAKDVMAIMACVTQVTGPGGGLTLAVPGGGLATFDAHFAERYDVMLEWIALAVQGNLSSFFAGLAALDAKVKKAVAPEAPEKGAEASSKSRKPADKTG